MSLPFIWEGYTVPFQSGKEKPEVPTIILLTFFSLPSKVFLLYSLKDII